MDIYQILITYNSGWTRLEIAAAIVALIIAAVVALLFVRRGKIRLFQAVSIVLMLAFLAVVFESTVFSRNPGIRRYQLEVFWSWKAILGANNAGIGSRALLQENILNMVLLLPLGLLLPCVRGRSVSWWRGLLIGVGISTLIEVLQLLLRRGLFEFDDIIHNGLGCMAGCIVSSMVVKCIIRKKH